MRFWDSSALLPLLVAEPASESVARLLSEDPDMLVWWGSPVECTSALARLEQDGALESDAAAEAHGRLRSLIPAWTEIQPTARLRMLAQRALRVHPLRAADSLQLAAALVAVGEDPGTLTFVCLDRRLGVAAEREGFPVIL